MPVRNAIKIPGQNGKGKPPGAFHRNKKATQYLELADRLRAEGKLEDATNCETLFHEQRLNQVRHQHHIPVSQVGKEPSYFQHSAHAVMVYVTA